MTAAKVAKNDEFYTQWADIEREMNAYLEYDADVFRDKVILLPCDDPEWSNFTKFFALHFTEYGLKKLISTSYAPDSKPHALTFQPTSSETNDPKYDPGMSRRKGKRFVLTREDFNGDGLVNVNDIQWEYLDGDGDFRSDEVTALRDEADIVITNPPFSLFRAFMTWLAAGDVRFSVIGRLTAISYKEVFSLIKANKVWLGNNYAHNGGAMFYEIPESVANLDQVREVRTDKDGKKTYITRVQGVRWFSNIEHGRRHEPLQLMTAADNKKFIKRKEVKDALYKKYDNFRAIEVPRVEAIPSDHSGVLGVPVSFLDKHNPDQYEILGLTEKGCFPKNLRVPKQAKYDRPYLGGRRMIFRLLIRKRPER
jgi:hypothetical protein